MAKRSGVPPSTLRAWERRYGILRPRRTAGGQRVYGPSDLARLRLLVAHQRAGLSISAAAKLVERSDGARGGPDLDELRGRLRFAIDRLDAAEVRFVATEAIGRLGIARGLDAVVVPALGHLHRGRVSSPLDVARERFAASTLRAHLVGYLPSEPAERGTCVAFCPEGDNHDLPVIMAATVLGDAGFLPVVLGADTPWASVEALVSDPRVEAVYVGSELRPAANALLGRWRRPAVDLVVLGGCGFRPEDAVRFRARFHEGGCVALAELVAPAGPPGTDLPDRLEGPAASRARRARRAGWPEGTT